MQDQPRLYVVRIWFDADGFRASARAAEAEESMQFDKPEALLDFLCRPPNPTHELEHPS